MITSSFFSIPISSLCLLIINGLGKWDGGIFNEAERIGQRSKQARGEETATKLEISLDLLM